MTNYLLSIVFLLVFFKEHAVFHPTLPWAFGNGLQYVLLWWVRMDSNHQRFLCHGFTARCLQPFGTRTHIETHYRGSTYLSISLQPLTQVGQYVSI